MRREELVRTERAKIIGLYTEQKLSVQQIAEALKMTPYRVRTTLIDSKISRRDTSAAARELHRTKHHKKAHSVKVNMSREETLLSVAGIMLYWGEGTKSGTSVALSNSDPDLILLFVRFLRKICGIDETRLRILMHYYPHQSERELKEFWARTVQIPLTQFSKSRIHNTSRGSYKRLSAYGTVSVRYSDVLLLDRLNYWIDEYRSKNLLP
ncbi:MAG: hypothetical protein AAB343_02480 [Patescibacteria group bacterium]